MRWFSIRSHHRETTAPLSPPSWELPSLWRTADHTSGLLTLSGRLLLPSPSASSMDTAAVTSHNHTHAHLCKGSSSPRHAELPALPSAHYRCLLKPGFPLEVTNAFFLPLPSLLWLGYSMRTFWSCNSWQTQAFTRSVQITSCLTGAHQTDPHFFLHTQWVTL